MNTLCRRQAELSRRHEVGEVPLPEPAQDIFDARRPLEGCDELAAEQLALGEVFPVLIRVDDLHDCPDCCRPECARAALS